jgi:pimeloyl-ACP methyl ester carboxylesterase
MINRRQLFLEGATPLGTTWPTWHTAGWLVVPDELRRAELQILVHGAGYDHRYWDWPAQRERYSYAEWAASRGLATLNVDRIGSGLSSKPPGAENTISAQAEILRQVVAAVRGGLIDGAEFSRIILIGHSLGSVVAGYEAASHGDVDAVVLTGYVPVDGAGEASDTFFETAFLPAAEELPHLRGLVDDDYGTSRAELRGPLMYLAGRCDPALIQMDEQMKGTATRGELRDAGTAGKLIRASRVPTLVLVGQYDRLLIHPPDKDCFDVTRRWAAVSPGHFTYHVVADSAHNLNLHDNAHESFEAMERWLDEHSRPDGSLITRART